jgi:hypothetical protein
MTQTGMILGTAAYMSPEQARGKPVDKRADIWAFGCVLYEMLTGRRAFGGETVTETLAAVLERPVDWTTLPPSTPANVRTVLRHTFEKDPKRRLHDIADARIQLDDTSLASSGVSSDVATRNVTPRWLMALGATAIVVGAAAWYLGFETAIDIAAGQRRHATGPHAEGAFPTSAETVLTLSPDGRRLAYAAAPNGVSRLFLRELDQFESKAIAGTEGATDPAFSADGKWIAFVAAGKIKKVTTMGDGLVTLSETQSDRSLSLSWESNDSILFSPTRATGIWRLSAAGGVPSPVTTLQEGELSHRSPAILPGGKSLLFSTTEGLGTGSIVVAQSLETGGNEVASDPAPALDTYPQDTCSTPSAARCSRCRSTPFASRFAEAPWLYFKASAKPWGARRSSQSPGPGRSPMSRPTTLKVRAPWCGSIAPAWNIRRLPPASTSRGRAWRPTVTASRLRSAADCRGRISETSGSWT